MTVISLAIPDELEMALQQIPGDVETFILETVRKQLAPRQWASDADLDIEASADTAIDCLGPDDVTYYLSLPNVKTGRHLVSRF